jgi:calcineurin-like phosphoesterase family protein
MKHDDDGEAGHSRRDALKCMAWAGTGLLWTLSGGIAGGALLPDAAASRPGRSAGLSFVQISDSHLGFDRAANPDPAATLRATVAQIQALAVPPAFVVHTGDITHLSQDQEFDDARQILSALSMPVHFIPGEHDVQGEGAGAAYLRHFGAGTQGHGWYSFDANGTHFVALVNVLELSAGGLGHLGAEQIAWLRNDLAGHGASTPIVVLGHMPMWNLYPEWGWGTDDSAQALALLNRFGSVTVLNGHIHQIQQKVEGHMTFHTARSTAYPQPAPGTAPSPGPLTVPAERLRSMLGLTSVRVTSRTGPLALVDSTLA